MPCVLMTEVDDSICLRRYRTVAGHRVDLREPLDGAQGRRRVQRTDAVGKREGNLWCNRPQGDDRVLQRAAS